jgi:hypothetical protein
MADSTTIWAVFPSGASLVARGRLTIIPEHHAVAVVPDDPSEPIVVLDPRAIVRTGGKVVYSPRAHLRCLPHWARRWLEEHPDWAKEAAA